MNNPQLVAVIGPNEKDCTAEIYRFGLDLGKALLDNHFWIVCGGKFGLMEAVCKGATQSEKYTFGCTLGLIPESDRYHANSFCDIVIPTGLGIARNFLVANTAEKIIAVAGGSGTLSEIAFAWQLGKKVICYTGFEGWAKKLAHEKLDNKQQGLMKAASSLEEVLELLKT